MCSSDLVSVAVEAVASLVTLPDDRAKEGQWTKFRARALECLENQPGLAESVKNRARGLIGSAGGKGIKQTLRELSEKSHVDMSNVESWDKVRNRHIHPKLTDLRLPGPAEYQELFTRLQCAGTLLHQLTFHLMGYEGPFTEYCENGIVSRQYPSSVPAKT